MSDEKIIRLVTRQERRPPEQAIELLRDIIERVERGEVVEVAIAGLTRNGEIATCWHGWGGTLLGPVQVLSARLIDDMRD